MTPEVFRYKNGRLLYVCTIYPDGAIHEEETHADGYYDTFTSLETWCDSFCNGTENYARNMLILTEEEYFVECL